MAENDWNETLEQVTKIRAMKRYVAMVAEAPKCFEPDPSLFMDLMAEEAAAVIENLQEWLMGQLEPSDDYIATANKKLRDGKIAESQGERDG